MLTPPDGLTGDLLTATLARGWDVAAAEIRYLPVGFGSHHWRAVDVAGARWFVTVDDLAQRRLSANERLDAVFVRLSAALAAATEVRDSGLAFVVAPVPTAAGQPVLRMTEGFAVALYPYLDGHSFPWGPFEDEAHRHSVLTLLVALHTAPARTSGQGMADDYAIPRRAELATVLDSPAGTAAGGPYGFRTEQLLLQHQAPIRRLLGHYDDLVAETRSLSPAIVLTHGEPHPGNTMLARDGWRLIDWDTAMLAPPERDLWLLATGDVLAAYADATGVTPRPSILELYRLRWQLTDLALTAARLCGPHSGDEDDEKSWQDLTSLVQGLS